MNSFKPFLAAAALVASVGTAPLFAQDPQPSMSGEGMSRVQVEAQITKIDKDASTITIQSKDVPGHTGADLSLPYVVTDVTLLDSFKDGDKILADVIVTDKGPTVEAIHTAPVNGTTTTEPAATTPPAGTASEPAPTPPTGVQTPDTATVRNNPEPVTPDSTQKVPTPTPSDPSQKDPTKY